MNALAAFIAILIALVAMAPQIILAIIILGR
jgi:hypothetical protein